MMAFIPEVASRHGLVIGTFGHAGDGNLHPTIVFKNSDAGSRESACAAFDEIVRKAMALGGTISGEHGVGSLKPAYLPSMVGEIELSLMRRIKGVFDPHGILNPGKAL
jgi:FAD/FMN-containing dehydrogenase